MTTSDITPACCDNPGKFDITRQKMKLVDGTIKEYIYQRKICNRCLYRKKKFKQFNSHDR